VEVWHSDLYRLSDVQEIEELGLIEAFGTAICFVEWPDRLCDLAPDDALGLTLAAGAEVGLRHARFEWTAARWRSRLPGGRHV